MIQNFLGIENMVSHSNLTIQNLQGIIRIYSRDVYDGLKSLSEE